jgi:hypothetical protein
MSNLPRSSKAREVTALLQRYDHVRNDAEKVSAVAMLNEVFPDIRFRHGFDNEHGISSNGLVVFFRAGRVGLPPQSVMLAAALVIKVGDDGQAILIKNRGVVAEGEWQAMELLVELNGQIPRKSRWDTIGSDEDWI